MRVGVVGLGNIGGAIAANLLDDGHELAVFDRDESRMAQPPLCGARAADVTEVARRSEVTLLSLPTPGVVREVAGHWLAGAPSDAVLVDLSTNSPSQVRALGEELRAADRWLLEAPLTGGAPGARRRLLVFLCGGDPRIFARCRGLLEGLGRAVYHFGPLGAGNTAKLVNSLLAFTATWSSLEGLCLAARSGLDLRQLVDAVRTAGAGNFFMDRMVEGINRRGRPAEFALSLAAKDAQLVVALAEELGVPVPLAEGVAGVLARASQLGLADRDFSDLVELAERDGACELRLPAPEAKP